MRRAFAWKLGVVALIGVASYAVSYASPWPAAFFYRLFMDRGGEAANVALARHVPAGIAALLDQRYDANDADAALDVYYPSRESGALPAIVWIHGGAFFSGDKGHVANYVKILAAKGYTTVSVGYSLGPS